MTLIATGSVSPPNRSCTWNGANRPTVFVSTSELHAAISAADIASIGTADVSVVTPPPGGGTSADGRRDDRPAVSGRSARRIRASGDRRRLQRGSHGGLRPPRVLPDLGGDARADGRLPPEGEPRLGLHAAAVRRAPVRGRAVPARRSPTGSRSCRPRASRAAAAAATLLPGLLRDARADGRLPAQGGARVRRTRRRRAPASSATSPARVPSRTGSSSSPRRASRPAAAAATTARTAP